MKEIYSLTLYELDQIGFIKKKINQLEYNSKVSLEYLNAQLNSWAFSAHPDRMPSLDKLLHKEKEDVVQDHKKILEMAKAAGIACPPTR